MSAAEVSALGAIPQTPAGAFVDFAEVIGGARPPVSGDSQYALSCLYMPDGVRPAPSQESPFFYSLQFAEPLVVEVDPLSACVGRRS